MRGRRSTILACYHDFQPTRARRRVMAPIFINHFCAQVISLRWARYKTFQFSYQSFLDFIQTQIQTLTMASTIAASSIVAVAPRAMAIKPASNKAAAKAVVNRTVAKTNSMQVWCVFWIIFCCICFRFLWIWESVRQRHVRLNMWVVWARLSLFPSQVWSPINNKYANYVSECTYTPWVHVLHFLGVLHVESRSLGVTAALVELHILQSYGCDIVNIRYETHWDKCNTSICYSMWYPSSLYLTHSWLQVLRDFLLSPTTVWRWDHQAGGLHCPQRIHPMLGVRWPRKCLHCLQQHRAHVQRSDLQLLWQPLLVHVEAPNVWMHWRSPGYQGDPGLHQGFPRCLHPPGCFRQREAGAVLHAFGAPPNWSPGVPASRQAQLVNEWECMYEFFDGFDVE